MSRGACPATGATHSKSIVAFAYANDDPALQPFNICSAHVEEYVKAKWKTLEYYSVKEPLVFRGERGSFVEAHGMKWSEEFYLSHPGGDWVCACGKGYGASSLHGSDKVCPECGRPQPTKVGNSKEGDYYSSYMVQTLSGLREVKCE